MITPQSLGLPGKFTTFRPGQVSAITSAVDSFNAGKSAVLLSAPPGSGKSPMYVSIARMMSDSTRILVLVVNKSLQTQLDNDFSPMGSFSIVGHSNYPCAHTSSDDDFECADRGSCLYNLRDIPAARKSWMVITNVAHWVSIQRSREPDRLGKFDLIVIDEAHKVADRTLVDMLAVSISLRQLSDLSMLPPDVNNLLLWAEALHERSHRQFQFLKSTSKSSQREIEQLSRLNRDLASLVESLRLGVKWVLQPSTSHLKLSPVWADTLARRYVYKDIPKIILSSGTLTQDTGRYLGIMPSVSSHIEMPSTFAAKNRPLIYLPVTKIDHKMSEGDIRLAMGVLDQFISHRFLLGKGVIHSRSYENAHNVIAKRSGYRDFMLTYKSGGLRAAIKRFMDSTPPSIITGPGMEEGLDLHGDLARWQVIWKYPHLDSRDPITRARMDEDPNYRWYVANDTVIQTYMRIIRSPIDIGECLIIDKHWGYARAKVAQPRWFRDAWVLWDRVLPPQIEM